MKKLIHLVLLVIVFGVSTAQADVNNRVNVKLTAGSKTYSDEFNKPAKLSAAPVLASETINGKPAKVWLVPIGNLKKFLDIDEFRWDKKQNTLTIYREKPTIIFNNSDNEGNTVVGELKRLISSADKSIDIEMYRLQEKSIIQTLADAGKTKKVKIRIILDKSGDNCRRGTIEPEKTIEESLESAGCDVRWKKNNKIMHRKTAIFDGETFYIGSGNWTDYGLGADEKKGKNWELNMIWRNKEYASEIVGDFDEVWNDSSCLDEDYECK